jgi:hypothetical protein
MAEVVASCRHWLGVRCSSIVAAYKPHGQVAGREAFGGTTGQVLELVLHSTAPHLTRMAKCLYCSTLVLAAQASCNIMQAVQGVMPMPSPMPSAEPSSRSVAGLAA